MAVPALEARRRRRRCSPPGPSPRGEAAWARAARARAARRGSPSAARRGAATSTGASPIPTSLTALPAPAGRGAARPTRRRCFDGVDRLRLVFVDGVFAPELSDAPALAGVEIQPLADGAAHRHPLGARRLRRARGAGPGPGRPAARRAQHRARDGGLRDPRRPAGRRRPVSFVYLRQRGDLGRADPPRDPARPRRRPDAARERRRRPRASTR